MPRVNPVPAGVLGTAECFSTELGFPKTPAGSVRPGYSLPAGQGSGRAGKSCSSFHSGAHGVVAALATPCVHRLGSAPSMITCPQLPAASCWIL